MFFFFISAENLFHDGKSDQAMEVGDPNSFESFLHSNPSEAEKCLKTVVEVTGKTDRPIIYKAFNQSRKSNGDFDVNNAIEWILTMSENSKTGRRIFFTSLNTICLNLSCYSEFSKLKIIFAA